MENSNDKAYNEFQIPNRKQVTNMAKREIKEENLKIGKSLQKARESKKVMQSEMEQPCGLTKNHISAVERGVSMASVKMLLGYCEKLNMTPNDILGFTEDNIKPELKALLNDSSREEQMKIAEIIKIMRR